MDFIQSLTEVLNFDPVLIGVFAGLAMLYVQALKPVWRFADNNPRIVVMLFTAVFSILIAFEVTIALTIMIINYLLLIGTTGLYEGAKSATESPKG